MNCPPRFTPLTHLPVAPLRSYLHASGPLHSRLLALSPDGSLLAYGSGSELVVVSLSNGQTLGHVPAPPGPQGLIFSSDNRLLCFGLGSCVAQWKAPELSPLSPIDIVLEGPSNQLFYSLFSAALCSDSSRLIAVGRESPSHQPHQQLTVGWFVPQAFVTWFYPKRDTVEVTLGTDGQTLALIHRYGLASIVDARTGEVLREVRPPNVFFSPQAGPVRGSIAHGLALSDRVSLLAALARPQEAGDGQSMDSPGRLVLLCNGSQREFDQSRGHIDQSTVLALSPDEALVAATTLDGNVGLWSLKGLHRIALLDLESCGDRAVFVAFAPSGTGLVVATAQGAVLTFDLAGGVARKNPSGVCPRCNASVVFPSAMARTQCHRCAAPLTIDRPYPPVLPHPAVYSSMSLDGVRWIGDETLLVEASLVQRSAQAPLAPLATDQLEKRLGACVSVRPTSLEHLAPGPSRSTKSTLDGTLLRVEHIELLRALESKLGRLALHTSGPGGPTLVRAAGRVIAYLQPPASPRHRELGVVERFEPQEGRGLVRLSQGLAVPFDASVAMSGPVPEGTEVEVELEGQPPRVTLLKELGTATLLAPQRYSVRGATEALHRAGLLQRLDAQAVGELLSTVHGPATVLDWQDIPALCIAHYGSGESTEAVADAVRVIRCDRERSPESLRKSAEALVSLVGMSHYPLQLNTEYAEVTLGQGSPMSVSDSFGEFAEWLGECLQSEGSSKKLFYFEDPRGEYEIYLLREPVQQASVRFLGAQLA